jgi:hypothetical protein
MSGAKPVLAAGALALIVAVSASADDGAGSAGVAVTAGSNAYRALRARASFDLPDSAYLAPRAEVYRSRDTNGTYRLFGLRGGYEPGRWSFDGDAALQPRVDGYQKSELGADAAYSFPLAEEEEGGAAFDLGGGFLLTRHSDLLADAGGAGGVGGAGGAPGRGRGVPRVSEFTVRESDLFAFGAWRGRAAVLSGRLTKASYDRDLGSANARRVLAPAGDAFNGAVLGFPDTIVSLLLRVESFSRVEPFVSWRRTTFALGDPPSTAAAAGATLTRGRAGLTASLEVERQRGFPARTYLTVGSSVGF